MGADEPGDGLTCVTTGVDTHSKDTHVRSLGTKCGEGSVEPYGCERARVWTVCVQEGEENSLSTKVRQFDGLAVLVAQGEVGS